MIEDYIAIQKTLSEYSIASSKRDVKEILATFASDGIWEVEVLGGEIKGKQAIHAAMSAFLAQTESWFQLNSPAIVEINGDTATAKSTIYESGKLVNGGIINVAAFYDDLLIRTSDGWKFARRTLIPILSVTQQR